MRNKNRNNPPTRKLVNSKTRQPIFRVGVFLNRRNKASREQVAGIFRFAGFHPEWELHLFARPDSRDALAEMAATFTPDGIVGGHSDVLSAFRRRVPCVLIDFADARSGANARVMCDDHAVGTRAAEEFLRRGFQSFGFAGVELGEDGGDSAAFNSRARENGFRRTLAKRGFQCSVYAESLPQGADHYADGRALEAWLAAMPKPCAVFAHTDLLAQSVLFACKRAAIPVPESVAVMGVDNEESACESSSPTLSSIEPDFAGGGFRAAEMLDALMRRGSAARVPARATYGVLRVVDRASTRNVVGAHLRAGRALETIRAHACSGISVPDVAAAVGTSTRMLEIVFRKTYNRTVRDEILRVRLEEAKRLLATTRLALAEIAARCGFRTASALKAVFTRRFGASPRSFRPRRKP